MPGESRESGRRLRKAQLAHVSPNIIKASAVIAVLVLLIALGRWLPGLGDDRFDVLHENEAVALRSDAGEADSTVSSAGESIFVHVVGAVRNPGVYELREGDRVLAAVEAAGGLRDDAFLEAVNLARDVVDGEQVHVPTVDEVQSPGSGKGLASVTDPSGGLVNINTASLEELQELPGVGPVTAASIIEYREGGGTFSTPEDIKNVSGIGDGKYAKLADKICV